jgi:hypothetical protein
MKYFEKTAVKFVLEQEEVSSKLIDKELKKSPAGAVVGSAALGGLATPMFFPRKGIAKNIKNILIGAGIGAGLGSAAELMKKHELQKELERRKSNPGYR